MPPPPAPVAVGCVHKFAWARRVEHLDSDCNDADGNIHGVTIDQTGRQANKKAGIHSARRRASYIRRCRFPRTLRCLRTFCLGTCRPSSGAPRTEYFHQCGTCCSQPTACTSLSVGAPRRCSQPDSQKGACQMRSCRRRGGRRTCPSCRSRRCESQWGQCSAGQDPAKGRDQQPRVHVKSNASS